MRAILVSLCLLLTVLAFAPEASARPCVLGSGTTDVCVNGDGSVCAYVVRDGGPVLWGCTAPGTLRYVCNEDNVHDDCLVVLPSVPPL